MRTRSLLMMFGLALASLPVVASAEVIKYNMIVKGEKVGTIETDSSGNLEEGVVEESTVTLKRDGKTVVIKETVKYGKDGIVTSKVMTLSADGREAKASAKLSDDGAKVSIVSDDQKDEQEIPLGSKVSRVDETNFWFKSVKPEVGKKVEYQYFDIQDLEWSDVTHVYVGKVKVKIGDTEQELHQIDRTDGEDKSTVYVDDKGDAVLIIQGEMRIERVVEATR